MKKMIFIQFMCLGLLLGAMPQVVLADNTSKNSSTLDRCVAVAAILAGLALGAYKYYQYNTKQQQAELLRKEQEESRYQEEQKQLDKIRQLEKELCLLKEKNENLQVQESEQEDLELLNETLEVLRKRLCSEKEKCKNLAKEKSRLENVVAKLRWDNVMQLEQVCLFKAQLKEEHNRLSQYTPSYIRAKYRNLYANARWI